MSSDTVARQAWLASAAAVLRKSGRLGAEDPDEAAWTKLAHGFLDGVEVPPIGTPSDVDALPTAAALAADPGEAPFLRGTHATPGWDVRTLLADPDPARARSTALEELSGGVTSLWIAVGPGALAPNDLSAVLDGVDLARTPVVLDTADDAHLDAGRALAALAHGRGARLHPASSLGADPIGAGVRVALGAGPEAAQPTPTAATTAAAVAEIATESGIGAIVVDGTVLHDAGASDVQEIGYSLAAGAAYLRILTDAGLDIDAACRVVSFRYAVTDDQFSQIAKLRSARLAWARVCELAGAAPDARAQHQHAVTSSVMQSRYDRHTNMLRGTVATFAAAVGGADAITTRPFDSALGEPDGFARRMARNVSALLVGESGLDQVADPAGGAGAIEMLTERLAKAAWRQFTSIEASGGIGSAESSAGLAASVTRARADRERRIATRRQPITGVSEFPNAAETAADLPLRAKSPASRPAHRWAEPYETMRDDPPQRPLLLIRVGTEARASVRVRFVENLLAAGGVATVHASAGADASACPDDNSGAASSVVSAVRDSGCRTVVFAGRDTDYAGALGDLASAAREGGATAVFLAGRPKHLLAELPERAFDGTVAAGDDALEFLRAVRATLRKTS